MTPEKSGEFSMMDIKVEKFTVSNFLKTQNDSSLLNSYRFQSSSVNGFLSNEINDKEPKYFGGVSSGEKNARLLGIQTPVKNKQINGQQDQCMCTPDTVNN